MTLFDALSRAVASGVRVQFRPEEDGVIVSCFSPGQHEASQFYKLPLSESCLPDDLEFQALACLVSEFGPSHEVAA